MHGVAIIPPGPAGGWRDLVGVGWRGSACGVQFRPDALDLAVEGPNLAAEFGSRERQPVVHGLDLAAHLRDSCLEVAPRDNVGSEFLAEGARHAFGLFGVHAGLSRGVVGDGLAPGLVLSRFDGLHDSDAGDREGRRDDVLSGRLA